MSAGRDGEAEGGLSTRADAVLRAPDDLLVRLRAVLLASGRGPGGPDSPPPPDPHGRTHAAALVLLYPGPGDGPTGRTPHFVLTRRTAALRRHSGQISLPGGRYDPEDGSLLRTALRETEEELGVNPASLTIWGRLDPEWITASHYLVAPFVAYTPRRPEFRPAPAEVAEVIEVPLGLLLAPDSLVEEIWELQGTPRRVSFYRHGAHKIWGATARILGQIASLLESGQAGLSAHPGGAGPGPDGRLAPGDVWPRSPRQLPS